MMYRLHKFCILHFAWTMLQMCTLCTKFIANFLTRHRCQRVSRSQFINAPSRSLFAWQNNMYTKNITVHLIVYLFSYALERWATNKYVKLEYFNHRVPHHNSTFAGYTWYQNHYWSQRNSKYFNNIETKYTKLSTGPNKTSMQEASSIYIGTVFAIMQLPDEAASVSTYKQNI